MTPLEYGKAKKFMCLYRDKNKFNGDYVIREVVKNTDHPHKGLYQYFNVMKDGVSSGHLIFDKEIIHIEEQQPDSVERIRKQYAEYFI